jgi:hypothetical protein
MQRLLDEESLTANARTARVAKPVDVGTTDGLHKMWILRIVDARWTPAGTTPGNLPFAERFRVSVAISPSDPTRPREGDDQGACCAAFLPKRTPTGRTSRHHRTNDPLVFPAKKRLWRILPARLRPLSGVLRAYRIDREGQQRVDLTRCPHRRGMAAICAKHPLPIAALDASIGRRARLQESPRGGPESAPKPPLRREIGFTEAGGRRPFLISRV